MQSFKKMFSFLFLSLFIVNVSSAQSFSAGAKVGPYGVGVEVVPLALKAKAEVLGAKLAVDGSAAFILTGEAALIVADTAGKTLDASTQAILVTGEKAAVLVNKYVATAYNGTKTVLVKTTQFADDALALTLDAIDAGTELGFNTVKTMTKSAKMGIHALSNVAGNSALLVTDTGILVLKEASNILGATTKTLKNVLGFILFPVLF